MQIEFLRRLESALLSLDPQAQGGLEAKIARCVHHSQSEYSQVRALSTPAGILEPYSCNIAFVLAAQCKRYWGEDISPLEFAQSILKTWDDLNLGADFEVASSTAGHLNFAATAETEAGLLRAFSERSSDEIFLSALEGQGIVGEAGENAGNLFPLAILPHREADADCAQDRYFKFIPKEPGASLMSRAEKSDEASRLLKESASQIQEDEDLQFMLLGLLGDSDLDARPFLKREYSRQNIPWYLKRFRQDFSRWSEKVSPLMRDRQSYETRVSSSAQTDSLTNLLHDLSHQILAVRSEYRQMLVSDRPELLLRLALKLIQSFYAIYNRPQVRDLRFYSERDSRADQFYFLMSIAAKLNWFLVGATRSYCKGTKFEGPPPVSTAAFRLIW